MSYEEISDKLKQIRMEDYIWIIYIGIIIASWYANELERKYFKCNDLVSKEKYRKVMIRIFIILVIVYLYFFKGSLSDINNIKPTDTDKKKKLVNLSFVGSLLILISGIIFLYIAYMDEDINVELAFN